MKSIKKLKLNHLCNSLLDERLQNELKGGACACGCVGCVCRVWDGTGCIPPSQNSSDLGAGCISANSSGNESSIK